MGTFSEQYVKNSSSISSVQSGNDVMWRKQMNVTA